MGAIIDKLNTRLEEYKNSEKVPYQPDEYYTALAAKIDLLEDLIHEFKDIDNTTIKTEVVNIETNHGDINF